MQKYRDRNGGCIAILLKSIGVGGQFDSRLMLAIWESAFSTPPRQLNWERGSTGVRPLLSGLKNANAKRRVFLNAKDLNASPGPEGSL